MSDTKKLLVVITQGIASDKATVALTIANAALSAGMEVAVFATADGVDLVRDGCGEVAHFKPFQPVSELLDGFVAGGGRLLGCGSCFTHRGMKEAQLSESATLAGVSSVVEWLNDGASTLCF